MPRYYFHVWEGDKRSPDLEGSDLPDLNAAIEEARGAARDIAADQLRSLEPIDGRKIEVTDEFGNSLAFVAIRDVIG
jgi:hypothetical protein